MRSNIFARRFIGPILYLCFSLLFVSCFKQEQNKQFVIKGCVVSAPSNLPVPGVLVRIMNDSYTLASHTTSDNGEFEITVDKDQIDASYYLSLYDNRLDVSKTVELQGFGLPEYDFGNIVFYDKRNPCDLPTIESQGHTLILHPVLGNKYNYEEALATCAKLNDYGIEDWSLPNNEELSDIFWKYDRQMKFPGGSYWTSTQYGNQYGHATWYGYSYSDGPKYSYGTTEHKEWYCYILPVCVL